MAQKVVDRKSSSVALWPVINAHGTSMYIIMVRQCTRSAVPQMTGGCPAVEMGLEHVGTTGVAGMGTLVPISESMLKPHFIGHAQKEHRDAYGCPYDTKIPSSVSCEIELIYNDLCWLHRMNHNDIGNQWKS